MTPLTCLLQICILFSFSLTVWSFSLAPPPIFAPSILTPYTLEFGCVRNTCHYFNFHFHAKNYENTVSCRVCSLILWAVFPLPPERGIWRTFELCMCFLQNHCSSCFPGLPRKTDHSLHAIPWNCQFWLSSVFASISQFFRITYK